MAAESERTLIHYSKKELTELKNDGTRNQIRYHSSSGKPDGFWYAYGETWKQLINSGKAGRNKANTSFRYEFRLPESAFVETIADASTDTIFKLSAGNRNEFMQQFVREEHHISKAQMIESAFIVKIQEGDSAILAELLAANPKFKRDHTKLKKRLLRGEEINFEKEINNLSTFSPSQRALRGDGLFLFNWRAFWKTVSESVGGVEFQEDLLTIDKWNDLHLTWTQPIAIHSGVIFHPTTFRDGILIKQLQNQLLVKSAGGKRYTRKKKSKRATRKC